MSLRSSSHLRSLIGISLLGALGTLLAPRTVMAAGYYAGNRGAQATARGGAFVAKADDLSAVMYNPAGLAGTDGTVIELGDRLSYSVLEFTRARTTDTGSVMMPQPVVSFAPATASGLQALDPMLGVRTNFGIQGLGVALAVYAPPGSAVAGFPQNGGSRYMVVNREALMLNYALSAAYRPIESFGIGVSLQAIVTPKIKYQLVVNGDPGAGSSPINNPFDMLATVDVKSNFTPNLTVGAWARPFSALELGASAQVIPANIVAKGSLKIAPVGSAVQGVNTWRADPILGQQAANDVELTLPLPLTFRAGARYVSREGGKEQFDIELDATYETWSRVDELSLKTKGLNATAALSAGGSRDIKIEDIHLQKKWQDTFTLALGGGYAVVQDFLNLRAGAYYESAVAKPDYASADFASGAHVGAGLGASLKVSSLEIGLALEFRQQLAVTVSEAQGKVLQQRPATPTIPGPVVNAGTYRAYTYGATLGLAYRF